MPGGKIRYAACLLACATGLAAQDASAPTPGQDEIEQLKDLVRKQQEQIDALRKRLDAQQVILESIRPTPVATQAPTAPAPRDSAPAKAPLYFELGGVTIIPTGFIDFSQVWRTRTVTSGLPTYFAAIPFSNTVLGHRGQTLSSAAHTRLGMRMNTRVSGFDVLGLLETDFLGYVPNNVATTTNSYGLRLRLAFADIRRSRWELLAGQYWSLLTPARRGISPLPETLFLTQDLDPNIQSGLVWARSPQLRLVFHASPSVSLGLSFESPNTYAGGSAGAGTITLPVSLAPNYFGQVDISTGNGNSVPSPNADWVAKIAFDTRAASRPFHFEMAGLMTRHAFYNPLNDRRFSITGGGITMNAGIEAVRHLTLLTNNFYTNGGGGFIFGEAPDLIIQGTGAPSLLPAASTVDGLEYDATPNWKFWAYYGGTWIDRISTFDPVALQPVGYGYLGSPNSQNRTVQEITGGFLRVLWKNRNYGTFQFAGQYSWLVRHPWYVGPSQPASANLNMVYLGLRYFLPGMLPALK